MPFMRRIKFDDRAMVQTDPRIHQVFKGRVETLAHEGHAAFGGTLPTLANVTNALWHWFASQPLADADAFLVAAYASLEKELRPQGDLPHANGTHPVEQAEDETKGTRRRKSR